MRPIAAIAATLVALIASSGPGLAQPRTADTLAEADIPRSVAAQMQCRTAAGPMTRRAFSGGFVFTQACAGSPAPMVRVVFAADQSGRDARLLQFHRPEGRRMSALASVDFPADGEIAGTTLRLTRRICRVEARWRMEGKIPAPGLVYWRQTRDCDGKSGWQTVLGRPR